MRALLSLVVLLLLRASGAAAQTNRTTQNLTVVPQAQIELPARQGSSYVLLAVGGLPATYGGSFNGLSTRLQHEHFWQPAWSWGSSLLVLTTGSGAYALFPEVLLRHRAGIFGGLTFGQRLSVERSVPNNLNYPTAPPNQGQNWGRLRLDVERVLPLGGAGGELSLRPRLSLEAATHLRLQKADADPDERGIQFTDLRAEVGLRLSPHLDFTPWFAYQAKYFVELPQYDANGAIKIPGGNSSAVFPTLGLDLRYTLPGKDTPADQPTLPTQH